MTCGRIPDGFHDSAGRPAPPAPRWIVLPDDPSAPWMYAPVRMLLADAAQLLRAAGYGDPLTTELPEGLPIG